MDRDRSSGPMGRLAGWLRREGKRVIVGTIGFAVVAVGVALLVLPGPGILVIIAGLAILATQFLWARRLEEKAKEKAKGAVDRFRSSRARRRDDDRDDDGRRETGAIGGRSEIP